MSTKDAVATMGAILPDDAGGRDAVHVAVVSAIAGQTLRPGDDVGFKTPTATAVGEQEAFIDGAPLGIVDPFIKGFVEKGKRFWLYLYPRTITGLRHQWTHPAFPEAVEGESYGTPGEKLKSQRWITEWADQYGVTFTDMVEAAKQHLKTGDYFCRGGTFEGERVPDEFWDHFQIVTGMFVNSIDRDSFFTCSC